MSFASSFIRKGTNPKDIVATDTIPGSTKQWSRSPLDAVLRINTGTVDLDALLNGGFPLGGLSIIYADTPTSYAHTLAGVYLSEGLASGQDVHIVSCDERRILKSLPRIADSPVEAHVSPTKMNIAWRYEKLSQPQKSATVAQRSFDMTHSVDDVFLKEHQDQIHLLQFTDDNYGDLLLKIKSCLDNKPQLVQRILVHVSLVDSQLPPLIHQLKRLICGTHATCLVTLPSFLMDDEHGSIIPHSTRNIQLEHMADIVFSIGSFACNEQKPTSLLSYHGSISVHKLHPTNAFHVKLPTMHPYVFKLKRRKFSIEPYIPPPEEEDENSTGTDEKSTNCGHIAHTQHGSVKLDF